MCILVVDDKEKKILLKTFSGLVNKTCLEHFTQKHGYGDDFIAILFKDNLDAYEDQEELKEIGDNRVVLFAEYPAAPIDEKFYLTFEELYEYVKQIIQEKYTNDQEMQNLLLKMKQALNI